VPMDYVQAADWYRKSAEQGNVTAQLNLGFIYHNGEGIDRDFVQAVQWWRKAADQGNPSAQYNLSASYLNGEGIERDLVEAYKWAELAIPNAAEESRPKYVALRGFLAARMTPETIADAQKRAREFAEELQRRKDEPTRRRR